METNIILISRKELYDQVWTVPIVKLAKKYGLSDVGLRKRCKKYKIPLPPLGYWAKKEFGKEPPRPLLPAYNGPEVIEFSINIDVPANRPVDNEQLAEAEARIQFEKEEKNRIHVSESLRSLHPLVEQTRKALENYKPGSFVRNDPILYASGNPALDIKVTKECLSRALLIMSALIKGLENRGFKVSIGSGDKYAQHKSKGTLVSVLGEVVEIQLREALKQTKREMPPKDWWWKKYEFINVPSGELSLEIKSWGSPRKRWSDGKKQRLEDCLNSFIVALIKTAVEIRTRANERKIEAQRREEQERQRIELARRRQEEEEKIRDLMKKAEDWNKSQQIRAYIQAVRIEAIQKYGRIDSESELAKWLTWAEQQADMLDPVKKI